MLFKEGVHVINRIYMCVGCTSVCKLLTQHLINSYVRGIN